MKKILFLLVLTGCGSQTTPKQNGVTNVSTSRIAIINSNYTSTSVALIDVASRSIETSQCMTSGTNVASLSTALSGDVVLPSQPQNNHELVLIDRTNGAITYVDPNTCLPRLQISVSTGSDANPHDVASVSVNKAYVTRYNGDDVLIINPQTGAVLGQIPLSSAATTAAVKARPDRIWLVGTRAYISLGEVSEDYKTVAAARVAIIDTATDTLVSTFDLPQRRGCSQVVADANSLAVACGGDSNDTSQMALSGVDFFTLDATAPVHTGAIEAADVGGRALAPTLLTFLGNNVTLAGTWGDFTGTPTDALWASGAPAVHVGDSPGSYELGNAVYDAATHYAFVSEGDADAPRVRVFAVTSGVAAEVTSIAAGADTGLPPRALAAL